ncbi:uncharacterized protein [Narcine bancroftii]|uniref:uncharacterized protein isoform X2 n=1 Tax=Narcine bancroftii TaxID=1343680 RepID=UPI003831FADE
MWQQRWNFRASVRCTHGYDNMSSSLSSWLANPIVPSQCDRTSGSGSSNTLEQRELHCVKFPPSLTKASSLLSLSFPAEQKPNIISYAKERRVGFIWSPAESPTSCQGGEKGICHIYLQSDGLCVQEQGPHAEGVGPTVLGLPGRPIMPSECPGMRPAVEGVGSEGSSARAASSGDGRSYYTCTSQVHCHLVRNKTSHT